MNKRYGKQVIWKQVMNIWDSVSKSLENFHFRVDCPFKEPAVMQRPENAGRRATFCVVSSTPLSV